MIRALKGDLNELSIIIELKSLTLPNFENFEYSSINVKSSNNNNNNNNSIVSRNFCIKKADGESKFGWFYCWGSGSRIVVRLFMWYYIIYALVMTKIK